MAEAHFKVYYWPGFSGRAEPILMLLTDAGVSFELVQGREAVQAGLAAAGDVFAVPLLVEEGSGLALSQTPAILEYLGNRFGFGVKAAEHAAAKASQVGLDIADLWAEAYSSRKGADQGAAFLEARLNRWLAVLEKGAAARGGAPFLFPGDAPSYLDYQWLNLHRCLAFLYGAAYSLAACPHLQASADALLARPRVVSYLASAVPVLYPSIAATN
ncbi:MAG: glutathione S-transferase family protein [archaeon]|nr:glutathione S-transferase family protein [archaeon]